MCDFKWDNHKNCVLLLLCCTAYRHDQNSCIRNSFKFLRCVCPLEHKYIKHSLDEKVFKWRNVFVSLPKLINLKYETILKVFFSWTPCLILKHLSCDVWGFEQKCELLFFSTKCKWRLIDLHKSWHFILHILNATTWLEFRSIQMQCLVVQNGEQQKCCWNFESLLFCQESRNKSFSP